MASGITNFARGVLARAVYGTVSIAWASGQRQNRWQRRLQRSQAKKTVRGVRPFLPGGLAEEPFTCKQRLYFKGVSSFSDGK